ncbi:unnamed protein product, partial [Callosobruchus maculatus]
MSNFIPDFKSGPLDFYRKRATFAWKKLKVFVETEDIVKYQFEVYRALRDHPSFNVDKKELSTFDGQRKVATMQALAHASIKQLSLIDNMHNLKIPSYGTRIMMQVSPGSTIKYFVRDELFSTAIMNMGTEKHMELVNAAQEGK